jgi:hypothetical protein
MQKKWRIITEFYAAVRLGHSLLDIWEYQFIFGNLEMANENR